MGKGADNKNESETNTTTITVTDYSTDAGVDQAGVGQGVVGKISNIVDSHIELNIEQRGLSGSELSELLTPSAQALESISRDVAATRSTAAATSSAISNTVDAAKETISSVVDSVVEFGKDAAPAVAVGTVAYLLLKGKKS